MTATTTTESAGTADSTGTPTHLIPAVPAGTPAQRPLWLVPVISIGVLVVLEIIFRAAGTHLFPTNWNINLHKPIDSFQHWVQDHRLTHPVFRYFFQPLQRGINNTLEWLIGKLLWLPWFVLPVAIFALVARSGRWFMAAVAGAVMVFPGLIGLWTPTMETLALITVAVAICVIVGVPLGIAAAQRPGFDKILRPVLDAMQTVPAPAYLFPAILFFSTGQVPAIIATVIYALPPVVRFTTLGIRNVPPSTVEAAHVFGTSKRQLLTKVQLPQAVPSIATGINQTINMALGIVVIAALVGAGGLGQEIIDELHKRAVGRGFIAGLAIVSLAIMLDRVCRSFIERKEPLPTTKSRLPIVAAVLGGLIALVIIGRAGGWSTFPQPLGLKFLDFLDDWVKSIRDTFRAQFTWINNFLVADIHVRTSNFLTNSVAWPVLIVASGALGFLVKGLRLAFFCAVAVLTIGLVGLWEPALQTLVQVLMATVIALLIAIPVGIYTGRHPRVDTAISPLLDFLQTLPSLVYAIPFVTIFDVGIVPGGIIASVLYAVPPGIRATGLGIRQVPESTIEAATTFGATKRQSLWGVSVPLALPTIMLAVNQVILIVIAMVIISGLTGGGALGYLIVDTSTRGNVGGGVEVALALALMAMVLDRLTQALAARFQPVAGR